MILWLSVIVIFNKNPYFQCMQIKISIMLHRYSWSITCSLFCLFSEPNPLCSTMNWPVNFSVGPPQPNPSCVRTTPPQSDLSHYPHTSNSGSSMVADTHGANLYYPPNKLGDFSRPYAHKPSGYQLAPNPSQNFPYKGFNTGATSSCSRSWFFNTVSYNLNPVAQRIAASSRLGGACPEPHCLASLTATGTTETPTDLTEHASADAGK